MNEKTKQLLKEREENENRMVELKNKNWALTVEVCKIEGSCPQCKNWHYPHC